MNEQLFVLWLFSVQRNHNVGVSRGWERALCMKGQPAVNERLPLLVRDFHGEQPLPQTTAASYTDRGPHAGHLQPCCDLSRTNI